MKSLLSIVAVAALALGGCKKDEKKEAAAPTADTTPATRADTTPAQPAQPAQPDTRADVDANADYVRVLAGHAEPKPTDPVVVSLTGFKVVKADFDPAKVEGGTADLEIDLTSLASGSAKRDNHLKSADYLDVGQFATAKIHVDNVKKTGENAYSADATIDVHGKQQKYPVSFTVLETLPDGIRIKGEHKFKRHDFAIGAAEGAEDSVATDLTIQLQLTLKKST
jgi:polyisoprenoid-binding protein YceI